MRCDITTREERLQSHIHRVWLNEWLDFTTIVGHEHSMTDQKCMHIHYLKRAQSSRTHSILTSTNSIRRFSLCLGFVFNFSFFCIFFGILRSLAVYFTHLFIHSFVTQKITSCNLSGHVNFYKCNKLITAQNFCAYLYTYIITLWTWTIDILLNTHRLR